MKNRISVFVPTYNREKELPRLLESLKNQDYKNFELLIVDDGSTDNTEKLIKQWISYDYFKINYIKKQNGGKHTAYNRAIDEVQTELFLELDSDDYLRDDALKTIISAWDTIENKEEFAGIQALCAYENGEIIGSKFPKKISNNYEIRSIDKVTGDKCMIYQSSKLKKHRLPEFDEVVVLMSILHNRVSIGLKTLCLNKTLKIVTYLDDGLTAVLSSKKKITRYNSFATKYNEINYFNPSFFRYIYYNARAVKYSLLSGKTIFQTYKNAIKKRFYFPIAFLYGYISYLSYKTRKK